VLARSFAAMAALSSLAVSPCSPTIATHGHALDEAAIARIEPGRTSRQEVLQLLGSPSSLASFDDDAWYYVSQRTENVSFYQEDLVEQDVIAITFDDRDLVDDIEALGVRAVVAESVMSTARRAADLARTVIDASR
jgi:outer membrane protein assembly factor BamE (lipoprotein component of BamABCDE complex)